MQRHEKADPGGSFPTKKRRWRRWMRLAAFVAVLLALLPNWSCSLATQAVPSLSPYVAMASAIAARAITATTLLALPVLCLILLRARWFCQYVCPTGLLTEMAGRVRTRRGARGARLPMVGPWLVLLTLGGACLGYPLLLWLDPLAIFVGTVNTMRSAVGKAAWLAGLGLPALLALSLFWPRVWCRKLCPLGATQDLLALGARAVRARSPASPVPLPGWRILRRTALGLGLGAIGAAGLVRGLIGRRPRRLRPPGAVNEDAFAGMCVRCGNCGRVCPSHIIHPDLGDGVDSLLTPVVRYHETYCLETCQRCTEVCPSGALRPLAAQEKHLAAIGWPRVDMDICLLGSDRECSICRTHCPYGAIRIVFCETDYMSVPQIDLHRCNGCGACQVMCPTQPIKAIVVEPYA